MVHKSDSDVDLEEFIIEVDELEELEDPLYDPTNTHQFAGYQFQTKYATYIFDMSGRVHTRPKIGSINGAELKMLAGLTLEEIQGINESYKGLPGKMSFMEGKAFLERLIQDYGREPRTGLYLAMTISDTSSVFVKNNGGYSSRIQKIILP